MPTANQEFFKSKVLDHPAGLFVLFFTEMWERFSFYGMRVLLINFLTMALIGYNPGWEWTAENAGALFGTYAMLLYLTPIIGGFIADKLTGYRWAVVIGAGIMTLGHASMAMDSELSLYVGLALLVIGTGFFKPNITSIISEIYKDFPEKKDGAYTIFYMGVNAGAFFGMMLCGYLAERIGWSWGFGLAGIFMMLGTLQFWLAAPLFGKIGEKPGEQEEAEEIEQHSLAETDENKEITKHNPFSLLDKILIVITAFIGIGFAFNDPLSKIANFDMFAFASLGGMEGQYVAVIAGLVLFLALVVSRIRRYAPIVRDRMIAFIVFAFFTVFFWMSFEQGATSLIIFARDNVDRTLSGNSAVIYNIINALLTIGPLAIITYVLFRLYQETHRKILSSNIVLAVCFLGVWGIALWMLNRDWNSKAYEVSYQAIEEPIVDNGSPILDDEGNQVYNYIPVTENTKVSVSDQLVERTIRISELADFQVGEQINIITKDNENSTYGYLPPDMLEVSRIRGEELGRDNGVVQATVTAIQSNEVEITTSWFSILNSFFIIAFASIFSKWFDSKYNPSAAVKYGLGLIIMGMGFGILAFGTHGLAGGVKVSMVWLVLAYLFHTLGELCLSPVGLSYVSKLVPARMIAFMFGMWYLAIAIGNKLAAGLGGQIENITEEYSLSTFFLIFTIIPAAAGILVMALNPVLKKLMHGVR